MQEAWKRARRLRQSTTDAERLLWRYLRGRQLSGHKFRRQYPIAGDIADFVCIPAGLVIELDGGQHLESVAYDTERTHVLQQHGYRVLRFRNDDVLLRTTEVLEAIWRELH